MHDVGMLIELTKYDATVTSAMPLTKVILPKEIK